MPGAPDQPTRISGEGGWIPPSVPRLQEALPAYEVLDLLGAGGMGAVYKARQKSLKRLVAIKILPVGMGEDEFQFVERFRNEAQTLAQMNHPAIVGVYDFGETPDGLLYFVMEFVDGTDVHQMIHANGKLSAEHALAITAHVCDALAYAHRNGVIHRDIKPANILINREGHVKVADFGLAKMHNPEQARGLTMSNMAMGTPDYAAPEVFKDVATVDHRADLYAVGVMLYQMLTGEVPRGFFKLPSEQGADPRFDAIIVKAMEASRDDRYQSALEVRHALDDILTTPLAKNDGTGAISARSLPARWIAASVAPPTGNTQGAGAPSAQVSRRGRPDSSAKWLVAAAAVAVLGVVGFFAMNGKKQRGAKTQAPATPALPAAKFSSAPSPAMAGKTIDLLPLVDVKRDALTVREITGAGKVDASSAGVITPAASAVATPAITTWQNVTASFREKTRGLPGVQLDADAVRLAEGATAQRITLTPPGVNHFAFRVRYTGGVQIDRLNSEGAFDFVMCQRRPGRVTFKRYTPSSGVTEDLAAGATMPAGYDETQPHEAVVLVEGPRLRIWVDGHFMGEARDERITSGSGAISLKSYTPIHQVEVANLTAASAAAPKDEMIDWLKDDVWNAPWVREDGAVKATANDATNWIGKIEDGMIHVRLRMTGTVMTNSPPLQIAMRATPLAGTTKNVRYLFQFFPQKRTCHLLHLEKGEAAGTETVEHLSRDKPFLPTTAGSNEFEFEIHAERDQLSVWSAGQVIASARDARVSSGSCGIIANPGIEITTLETVGVAPAGASASVRPPPPPAMKHWQDVTDMLRESARTKSGYTIDETGVRRGEDSPIGDTRVMGPSKTDRVVRVRYVGQAQVSLWFSKTSGSAFVLAQCDRVMFKRQVEKAGESISIVPTVMHPAGFDPTQPHELTIAVLGPVVRAWVDGHYISEGRDDGLAACAIAVVPMKNATVQKVEIAELATDAGATSKPAPSSSGPIAATNASAPPSDSSALPKNASWQDVTDIAREKAKATQGLIVDAQGIRSDGKSSGVRLLLTPPGQHDQAIFVRYTGEAQVDLHYSPSGFLYVLAQVHQMVMQSQAGGKEPPVKLAPDKRHPADFDTERPHELLVTIEGTRLRTWLDGRFVVEAKADTFTEGATALTFLRKTVVHKVERAELASATSDAWQPIFDDPSDFGGDLRDVEFRGGATFLKGRTFRAPAEPPLAAIRSTMRYLEGDRTGSLTIRSTEPALYGEEDFGLTAFIAPKGAGLVVKMRDRPAGINGLGRHDFPLSPALKEGELFTFELKAEGRKITASINGCEVGSLDDRWTGTTRRFGITPSNTEMTEFRDVAVRADR